METFKVFVRTDENGIITAINSSAFLSDTRGWIEIDEGSGDRYRHAQNHYLSHPIIDIDGIYIFKLVNGIPELRTEDDKASERKRMSVEQKITDLKRKLAETDYIGIKIGEGAATSQEYANELAERETWRAQINELEIYV